MPAGQHGLSLLELLLGLALGILVLLGLERLFVSSVRANTTTLLSIRLNQDLRSSLQQISRDLRRNGHDPTAWSRFPGNPLRQPIGHVHISPAQDCILFSYAAASENPAANWRGYRLRRGAIQVKTGGGSAGDVTPRPALPLDPPLIPDPGTVRIDAAGRPMTAGDCQAGTWQSLTDANVVRISALQFGYRTERFVAAHRCTVPPDHPTSQTGVYRRLIDITLEGAAVAEPTMRRTMHTSVRLRNDFINPGEADAACPGSAA